MSEIKELPPEERVKELNKLEEAVLKEKVEAKREIREKILEEIETTVEQPTKEVQESPPQRSKKEESIEELVSDAPENQQNHQQNHTVSYDPVKQTVSYTQQADEKKDSFYSAEKGGALYKEPELLHHREQVAGYDQRKHDDDRKGIKSKSWERESFYN